MDINAVYACIGYGASRAALSDGFRKSPIHMPLRYILETARDPVQYCFDALADNDPEAAATFDRDAAAMVLRRLRREARFETGH